MQTPPQPDRYMFLYGGPIGDSMVAIHIGRTLAANVPGAVLELVSTREIPFVRELCRDLPFIRYRSLPKESLKSWLNIFALAFSRNYSMAYEPVTSTMSAWWKLILWFARRRPGSIQVRYQMHGYEPRVPRGVVRLVYDCEKLSLFETPRFVLGAWGIEAKNLPTPSLQKRQGPPGRPYILFHFFAGQVRRSIPVDHARAILAAARAAYPLHEFVLTCAQGERERAQRMAAGMEDARIESGHTPQELMSLLCGADLIVGTASGILILAAHFGGPIVSMSNRSHKRAFETDFSPGTTTLSAYDECRCRPGNGSACQVVTDEGSIYRCIYFIKTDDVLEAMESKLPKDR
jgi:ADP-heptose:LPS heptosyltransferase